MGQVSGSLSRDSHKPQARVGNCRHVPKGYLTPLQRNRQAEEGPVFLGPCVPSSGGLCSHGLPFPALWSLGVQAFLRSLLSLPRWGLLILPTLYYHCLFLLAQP